MNDSLFTPSSYKELFFNLFNCKNESEVEDFINNNPEIFKHDNWFPDD